MSSIQIFACDHRKDVQWDLPYIRLGNYQSDAAINIKDDKEIAPYQLLLSEGAQMWWVYKHYMELGNPEYVGFCHYRRFFSFAIKQLIQDIHQSDFNAKYCASQIQIIQTLLQNSLCGASIVPFQTTSNVEYQFTDIISQLKFLSQKDKLQIPNNIIDDAFKMFFENANDDIRPYLKEAIKNNKTYVCNIFILHKDECLDYSKNAFSVFKHLMNNLSLEQLNNIHPRFMGYILERFTSLYLTALNLMNKRIGIFPVLTVDASVHMKWDAQTKGDYKDILK